MKRILCLIALLGALFVSASAQQTALRVNGVTYIMVKMDSSKFYNPIENTTFQILDSVPVPPSPPQGKVYLYARGILGVWAKFSTGTTIRLDSIGTGGAATDTTS